MTHDLKKKLKSGWNTYTVSEQKIATYLLQNIGNIPFESAASLAKGIGVSPMTIGRFLKKLGYVGVDTMKDELRADDTWLRLYRNPLRSNGAVINAKNLNLELRMLSKVYGLSHNDEWRPIVKRLASSTRVSIASFELTGFLGMALATLLQYVRPHVTFASGTDGVYSSVLLDSTDKDCVVLIDERRYSRHFRVLAEQVAMRKIPLIIITDAQCYWAWELTPHVLMVPTSSVRAWHNFGAFSILFSLLLDDVIQDQRDVVYDRIKQINELRLEFVGFSSPARTSRGTRIGAPVSDDSGVTSERVRKHRRDTSR